MTRYSKCCLTCCATVLLLLLGEQGLSLTSTALAFQTQTAVRSASKTSYRTTRKKTSRMSIESIRAALKRNPNDALLYYRAGYLEEQKGDLFQALRDYQTAIKLKARVAESYFRMGVIWEKTGELYDLKGSAKGRVVSAPHRRRVAARGTYLGGPGKYCAVPSAWRAPAFRSSGRRR